jgi:hypothetical protein
MSTTVPDSRELQELQPAHALWKQYVPEDAPYRFHAKDLIQAEQWQKETRQALADVIGFQSAPAVPLEPQVIEEVDKGDYVREKILLRTSPNSLMPVYLLLPKQGPKPRPVVIAFHGHGYGVKDIVGLWEDGEERDVPDGYHKDFAVALCRRGFAVAAPEISCFAGLSPRWLCRRAASIRRTATGRLFAEPLRRGYEPPGGDGHLGRRDAHLFLHLPGRADQGLRGKRLLFHVPGQHPGHVTLCVQFRPRPASLWRDV